MTEAGDAELVKLAAAGSEPAFGQLMRRHKEPLYRLIRRLTGDPDAAYDVLQDCMVSIWHGLARFDETRSFQPWAQRIAINKVRDWGRRRAVRRFLTGAADEAVMARAVDPAPLPDMQAADRQALAALDSAIAALPLALRLPLVLTAIEGLSHAEAGAQLGISAKAVETKVARARRQLAEAIRQL